MKNDFLNKTSLRWLIFLKNSQKLLAQHPSSCASESSQRQIFVLIGIFTSQRLGWPGLGNTKIILNSSNIGYLVLV
jgi:hypothetical protein